MSLLKRIERGCRAIATTPGGFQPFCKGIAMWLTGLSLFGGVADRKIFSVVSNVRPPVDLDSILSLAFVIRA